MREQFQTSYYFLRKNPSWLIFSLMTVGMGSLVILAGLFSINGYFTYYENSKWVYWIFIGFLFLSAVVSTLFLNVALSTVIISKMQGQDLSIASGLRLAWSRLDMIIAWNIVMGLFGILMYPFFRRDFSSVLYRWVGISFAIGLKAFQFFAVPILVVEGLSPFAVMKRSALLVKHGLGGVITEFINIWVIKVIALTAVLLGALPAFSLINALGIDLSFEGILFISLFPCLVVLGIFNAARNVFVAKLYLEATGWVLASSDQREKKG